MCVLSRVGSCDDGEVVVEAAAAANVRRKKERKKETEKDSCSRSSWGRERERERDQLVAVMLFALKTDSCAGFSWTVCSQSYEV